MVSYDDKPWLSSYEAEVETDYEVPDIPVHRLLEDSAHRYPNHEALIFKGNKITYQELNEQADAIAAAMAANGFKKGDRAVIYMANCPQFVISPFIM